METIIYSCIGGIFAALGLLTIGFFAAPRLTIRAIFRPILELCYRGRVVGLENLPKSGGVFVVSNHISWIDGILILWLLPRNVRFIVDGGNFKSGFLERVAGAFDTILMTPSPKSIARALQQGRDAVAQGDCVGIFPEGTLSRNAQFQGFRPGLNKLLKDRGGPVLPVWLDGMWGSIFSFSGGKFFLKKPSFKRRTITLFIGETVPPETPLNIIRARVAELGSIAMENKLENDLTLPRRMLRAWKQAGSRLKAADSTGAEASGKQLLLRTLVLQRVLRREVLEDDDKFVGVLLPPSVGGLVTNVALSFDQRVAINLNYSASAETINQCMEVAGIRTVLTSKKFIEKLGFTLNAKVIELEDIKPKVRTSDKIAAAVGTYVLPAGILDRMLGLQKIQSNDLLTVVFTSGSTGTPKGVMLSYANVGHNVDAVGVAIGLHDKDVVLGILPFFHSFGYAITLWAAQVLPPAAVYHFNPLDARTVGKIAGKYDASVLLATPTFMRGFLRRVTPEQFAKLNVAVAGAEKTPADLFDAFEKKFGVRISEGYGATELSPLVSVNIPASRSVASFQPDAREGAVGRPVPGVTAKIVDPDTFEELGDEAEGMLLVTGPNVMLGYMGRQDLTDEVIRDGWYVTGDMARIDKDGFIHITGRQSRFSKIGGEMVPHIRVEEALVAQLSHVADTDGDGDVDQDDRPVLVVTSVADERKGERLIVLHRSMDKSAEQLRAGLTELGFPNLYLPAADAFYQVDEIPLLGSGKLDLKRAQSMAQDCVAKG